MLTDDGCGPPDNRALWLRIVLVAVVVIASVHRRRGGGVGRVFCQFTRTLSGRQARDKRAGRSGSGKPLPNEADLSGREWANKPGSLTWPSTTRVGLGDRRTASSATRRMRMKAVAAIILEPRRFIPGRQGGDDRRAEESGLPED